MKRLHRRLSFTGPAIIAVVVVLGFHTDVHGDAKKQPDNTEVNKRDQQKGKLTAEQQKEKPTDLEITRQIRVAVVANESLSTYAHNVKIITRDGRVTLRGPVKTKEEKRQVEDIAARVAGRDRVTSEIEVSQ